MFNPPSRLDICQWIQERFSGPEPKVFVEVGAHKGYDTAWMAKIPNTVVHAFEPDPRNVVPYAPNIIFNRKAVSDKDGTASFVLSQSYDDNREWTYSSSLKKPKNHLSRYPVKFNEKPITVETIRLDTYCKDIPVVDLIWADVQGAEGEMILGGLETLKKTRYLYTEYSNQEMYEGQINLDKILGLLPDFQIMEIWDDDVLLVNRTLVP